MTSAVAPDAAELRDLAVAFATEAGRLLLDAVDGPREVHTKSTTTDMVTEMDRASEALLVSRILAARPHDGIIGEEGTEREPSDGSTVTWVIDPLDGTTNYLYRLPGWNVSVGVEVDEVPVAGAVVIPTTSDVYAAAAGAGATHNGERLEAAEPPPLGQMLFGTGFAYEPEVRAVQGAAAGRLLPRVRDLRRFGAAAADLCSVASGRLDAYYESGLARWDRCAGSVIATEAGLRVETFDAAPLPGVLTVATHPDAWDQVIRLLEDVGVIPRA